MATILNSLVVRAVWDPVEGADAYEIELSAGGVGSLRQTEWRGVDLWRDSMGIDAVVSLRACALRLNEQGETVYRGPCGPRSEEMIFVVPEPPGLLTLIMGIVMLVAWARKKRTTWARKRRRTIAVSPSR